MQITDRIAIDFARYIRNNPSKVEEVRYKMFHQDDHSTYYEESSMKKYDNIEELFEEFIKTNNEQTTNSTNQQRLAYQRG